MTAEGWEAQSVASGSGGNVRGPSSSGTAGGQRTEAALSAAELNLRVRSDFMALQVSRVIIWDTFWTFEINADPRSFPG